MKKSMVIILVLVGLVSAGTFAGATMLKNLKQDSQVPKPGAEHAVLKQFEGDWDAVTSGMGQSTKGTQSSKLACDGMWLMTTYHGEFMGQKFEGRGLMGYDLDGKKYQNVWVDSMISKISVDNGAWDPKTKTLTFDSKGQDGSPQKMVFNFPDADHYVLRFVGQDKDGKDVEQFKITYTRQAAKTEKK